MCNFGRLRAGGPPHNHPPLPAGIREGVIHLSIDLLLVALITSHHITCVLYAMVIVSIVIAVVVDVHPAPSIVHPLHCTCTAQVALVARATVLNNKSFYVEPG